MDRYGIKRVRILFAVIPLLLLVSCSKDDIEPEQTFYDGGNTVNGGDIDFRIDLTSPTRVKTDMEFKSSWDDGDAVGIFAVSRAAGGSASLAASGNYINNVKITYSNAGGGKWTVAENLYFPGGGNVLDFYAYYPYDASKGDPTNMTFNVEADQNADTGGKSNYDLSEVLAAKATGAEIGSTVNLTFSHSMAMVQVKLYGRDFNDYPPQVEARRIITASKLDFNAAGGPAATATGTARKTVNMRLADIDYQAPNNDTLVYRALVPVQTLEKGRPVFYVRYRDKAFMSPVLTSDLALAAGTAYVYRQGSVSGIFTAADLVRFSADWNTAGAISNAANRKTAQDKVIAEWGDTGDKDGVVRIWADIDMTGVANFTPIGLNGNGAFTGGFDGGGFMISNLNIDRGTNSYAGLFGYMTGGAVRNVVLEECNIKGAVNVGGIVGFNSAGTVSGCHVKNVILTSNSYGTGGIAGDSRNGANISDCKVTGAVLTAPSYSGGIAGNSINNSTISGCAVTGTTVTASNNYSGGIAGYNSSQDSKIEGCEVTGGNVAANDNAGGIVGRNFSMVGGCKVAGTVVSATGGQAGGIVGGNEVGGVVRGCIASPGGVTGTLRGIVAGQNNNQITACYWGSLTNLYAVGSDAGLLSGNGFNRIGFGSYFTTRNSNDVVPVDDMNTAIQGSGYVWAAGASGQYPAIVKE